MKNFALMGASGYIAPKHLGAIKDTNNKLLVAYDKSDSVGIIDSFFPKSDFFVEFERFDRHVDKLRFDEKRKIDYITICTPNYLHDSHIRFALRNDANAICEKPLVLNPWNLDTLVKIQNRTGKKVFNILQLRLHESIIKLKDIIEKGPKDKVYDIDLTYITSRGNWYYTSWKGDVTKSGGLASNIGIHFFDMLCWIFGNVKINKVHLREHDRSAGYLEFEKARVRWFLSINSELIPEKQKALGQRTFRSILIEGKEFEFSSGFDKLHTKVYENILNGKGFSIEDSRKSIEVAYQIRNVNLSKIEGDYHPMVRHPLSKHPFL